MKKLIWKYYPILMVFILCLISYKFVFAESQQIDDLTLYFFTSDETKTVAWDRVINATEYNFRLWNVERKEFSLLATVPDSGEGTTKISFNVPFTGHFYGYVRAVVKPFTQDQKDLINSSTSLTDLKALVPNACDINDWWNENATLDQMKTKMLEIDSQCSEWTITIDADNCRVTLPDGTMVNKGWWLYGYPAPPTGGGIIIQ